MTLTCVFAGGVKAIAAGSFHSMVLTENGDVWTTGWNGKGQLGDGTRSDKNRFTKVIGTGTLHCGIYFWALGLR